MNWDDNKGGIIASAAVAAIVVIVHLGWGYFQPNSVKFMPWQSFDLRKWYNIISADLILLCVGFGAWTIMPVEFTVRPEERSKRPYICGVLAVIFFIAWVATMIGGAFL